MTSPSKAAVAITLITATILAACSSGDSSDSTSLDLEGRMATAAKFDSVEGWVCKSSQGVNLIYWLYEPGSVYGVDPRYRLGMELDPTKASFADQMRFQWSATGNNSVMLDARDRGIQIDFTDIEFTNEDFVTLNSSHRGTLWCSRELATRDAAS